MSRKTSYLHNWREDGDASRMCGTDMLLQADPCQMNPDFPPPHLTGVRRLLWTLSDKKKDRGQETARILVDIQTKLNSKRFLINFTFSKVMKLNCYFFIFA